MDNGFYVAKCMVVGGIPGILFPSAVDDLRKASGSCASDLHCADHKGAPLAYCKDHKELCCETCLLFSHFRCGLGDAIVSIGTLRDERSAELERAAEEIRAVLLPAVERSIADDLVAFRSAKIKSPEVIARHRSSQACLTARRTQMEMRLRSIADAVNSRSLAVMQRAAGAVTSVKMCEEEFPLPCPVYE